MRKGLLGYYAERSSRVLCGKVFLGNMRKGTLFMLFRNTLISIVL